MKNETHAIKKWHIAVAGLVLVIAAIAAWSITRGERDHSGSAGAHGHAGEEAAEVQKGPNGGRLLTDGDFAVEVTIFERGVPPEFRVFTYEKGKPIDPAQVGLTINLHRFAGRIDRIQFTSHENYLLGDSEVVEPHSFDVEVLAEYKGNSHQWQYDSYEGRTTLTPEAAEKSGIVVEEAGRARIKSVVRVSGRVRPDEDHMTHVIPRFPGIATRVLKRLGEPVEKNEVVAIVESNESLQPYEVRSSIAGTVIRKGVTQGEFAREGEVIYTVADLQTVWVDFNVNRDDFDDLKLGQTATVFAGNGETVAQGKVSYLSPFGSEETQTMLARVVLPNPTREWRPGLFVTGEIVIEEAEVPVAVKVSALQTFRDWDVVFMVDENVFEIAILELGRRDGERVEVLSGLPAGQRYVADNSFIVKADIGKSGATHDH